MSPPWNDHCLECGALTKGGKPFCLEHLGEMPEVKRICGDLGQVFDPGYLKSNEYKKATERYRRASPVDSEDDMGNGSDWDLEPSEELL